MHAIHDFRFDQGRSYHPFILYHPNPDDFQDIVSELAALS